MTEKTEGEKRVRVDFNASNLDEVYSTKVGYARLIDATLKIGGREAAIAASNLETACMYHVKALTAGVAA